MKFFLAFLMAMIFISCDNGSVSNESAEQKKTDKENITASGKVFEYGIYSAQRNGRVRENLSTNTGKVVTKPVLVLSETTKRIPLVKNTFFAYRYRLLNLPKEEVKKPTVELRKVLVHPEMTLPDGSKSTGWDRKIRGRTSIGQVIAFDGYVFNEDYEMVEGDWVFQIWFDDQKLVEHTFTTYKATKLKVDLTDNSFSSDNNI